MQGFPPGALGLKMILNLGRDHNILVIYKDNEPELLLRTVKVVDNYILNQPPWPAMMSCP